MVLVEHMWNINNRCLILLNNHIQYSGYCNITTIMVIEFFFVKNVLKSWFTLY